MTVINTNVQSIVARQTMSINSRNMSQAMEQLSTGKRINSAKDDAAGMAVSESMTSQIRGMDMAVRNANDAVSLMQTAEGAMVEQSNMLQRMRELSVQASTDTLSDTQRGYLDKEYGKLKDEIDHIASKTAWNGMSVLDGSKGSGSTAGTFTFQIGTAAGDTMDVQLKKMDTTSTGELSGVAASISTRTEASGAISTIDGALDKINDMRAELGANMNRLTHVTDNLTSMSTNVAASRSRIMDTDYAKATTELARTQIIQQASTAMLAQANQSPQGVLSLLR